MRRSMLSAIVAGLALLSPVVAQTDTKEPPADKKTTTEKKKQDSKAAKDKTRNRKTETSEQPEVRPGKGVTPPDPTRPGTPPTFPRTAPEKNTPVNPPDPTSPTTSKPPAS